MDCEKVCEQICSYLDNEMDEQTKITFEKHIATCEKCNRELNTCSCIKSRVQKGLKSIKAPNFLKQKISLVLQNSHNYRDSGIPALDLIKWGTHIAQLYNNKSDLPEVLIPYILKGLEENEKCLWVTSDISVSEAEKTLIEFSPNTEKYLNNGQLEILFYKDWYLAKGQFDAKNVIDSAFDKYQNAISNGYSGLRAIGTTQWLDMDSWNILLDLEDLLDKSISNEKILLVCTYKQDKCGEEKIADIMNHHKYVLFKSNGLWELKRSCIE
ncbi:TPA: hypothetical protein ENS27_01455 [bacterium]|nr:hypothetical protein [bacterium]